MEELLLDQEQDGKEIKDVSKGVRLGTYLIDAVVLYVLQTVVLVIVGISTVAVDSNAMQDRGYFWKTQLITWSLFFLYYLIMEINGGRTIGKYALGVKVVSLQGGKPSASQVAGRTLTRLIPFEAFSFLGSSDRGWHDKWSNTRVIKIKK